MTTKQQLHQVCAAQLAHKISELENRLADIEESKNNETKSSAGDKYETGRAMMQMEADKVLAQLELTQQTQSQLRQLDASIVYTEAKVGSLVLTRQRNYYLGISLGKVSLAGTTYYCISTSSPIGKLLLGQQVGATITFNGKSDKIEALH